MNIFIQKIYGNEKFKFLTLSFLFIICGYGIGVLSLEPSKIRLLFSGVLILGLTALSMRKPVLVLYGSLIFLPFLGFFRRILIPVAGWSSFDPIVILVPFVVLLIGSYWLFNKFIHHQTQFIGKETKLLLLVQWLMCIHFFEVFNPIQGSIFAGLAGIIFNMVPLFWMVLGRKYFTEYWMKAVIYSGFIIGIIAALYGVKQMVYGFFGFEKDWIKLGGYASLMVGHNSRPFSFFTSSGEYAQYLVIAIIIAWIFILKGNQIQRIFALLGFPFLGYALFIESSRGSLVLCLLSVMIITIFSSRKSQIRILLFLSSVLIFIMLYMLLTHITISSNETLISHQLGGLSHPFNKKDSTLGIHLRMFEQGFWDGIKMPIGHGLGSTTIAGMKFSNSGSNTEVDLSNMFFSDGVIGGLLYVVIFVKTLRLAFSAVNRSASLINLVILGVLLGTLGNWSIGGNYSTVALIWLSIGYLDKMTQHHKINRVKEGLL